MNFGCIDLELPTYYKVALISQEFFTRVARATILSTESIRIETPVSLFRYFPALTIPINKVPFTR